MIDFANLMEQPHHDGSPLYTEPVTPVLGGTVRVWVRVPAGTVVSDVHVRTTPDGEPCFTRALKDDSRSGHAIGGYGANDTWWAADVRVGNPVTNYRFLIHDGTGRAAWLTAAGIADYDLPDASDFRLTVYAPGPDWATDAIVYEIFPDRFARRGGPLPPSLLPDWAVACEWDSDPVVSDGPVTARQLYGGNLDGIVDHLDHLQSLSVNTVYLRPVFPADSNHRYNATTFDEVDPLLGGDAALGRLGDAIHQRGMRIIGDITTNHCGDSHAWFRTALSDQNAPERDMFYFHHDGSYESWYGVPTLPKLNWGNELLRDRLTKVVRRWMDVYDGWRVDVANMTGRYRDEDRTREIAAALRHEITEARPDAVLIAEHNHDAAGDLDAGGWQGTMNYAGFLRPVWTWLRADTLNLPDFIGVPGGVPRRAGRDVLSTLRSFNAQLSWASYTRSWQSLDTYDSARIRTVTGSRERHLVAAGLQATLPGTPAICGGSEYGLTGDNGEHARTPMPWQRPSDRDDATFHAYQQLFRLRATEPALRSGSLRWLHADADTLVFLRETEHESLLIAATRTERGPLALPLDAPLAGVYRADDATPVDGRVTLDAAPAAFRIWRVGRDQH